MLRTETDRDLDAGITTVRVTGELTPDAALTVRTVIVKAAGECPAAVLVDLSDLWHRDDALLRVFASTTHEAQLHWGVPVLLCEAGPEVARGLGPFRNYVALYEDRLQATLAVRACVPRWIRRRLTPASGSVRLARGVTGEACLTWGVDHLRDPARLVASELAANAVVHTGAAFDLLVVHTGRFLRVAVQDSSSAMPRMATDPPVTSTFMRPGSGRGLRVVAAAATYWGVTRLPGGKIVWALVRTNA
ncbi:MAG TPA: STAS domain-containing protein [Actinoplanes sp.]|nr:STAS domain-containing protein [Actinoplanes sp.]